MAISVPIVMGKRLGQVGCVGALLIPLLIGCAPRASETGLTPTDGNRATVTPPRAHRKPPIADRIRPPEVPSPVTPQHPGERIVELGRSVLGEPIRAHLFGDGDRPLLIFAGIHGSEPTSTFVAERLIEWLRDAPGELPGVSVVIIPRANPDGLRRRRRGNHNGVDLNRNFPSRNWKKTRARGRYHGGPKAASEPETRALIEAVERFNPGAVISIHSITRGRECNNYDGPGEALATLLARLNGYPATATIGYPTPGSFGSWAGDDRGIPVVTLELPRREAGAHSWDTNRDALLAAVRSNGDAVGE
jgi:protein MpaA